VCNNELSDRAWVGVGIGLLIYLTILSVFIDYMDTRHKKSKQAPYNSSQEAPGTTEQPTEADEGRADPVELEDLSPSQMGSEIQPRLITSMALTFTMNVGDEHVMVLMTQDGQVTNRYLVDEQGVIIRELDVAPISSPTQNLPNR
jgi:hypothetical protein